MRNLSNKVQLIGNLGMDPKVKNLNSGKKVVNFTVATSHYYKDVQGNRTQDTQWHNIVAWGHIAQIVEKYLSKGNKVAVEGKLVHRSYESKDGQKRYITEVVANDLVMLTKKSEESQ